MFPDDLLFRMYSPEHASCLLEVRFSENTPKITGVSTGLFWASRQKLWCRRDLDDRVSSLHFPGHDRVCSHSSEAKECT